MYVSYSAKVSSGFCTILELVLILSVLICNVCLAHISMIFEPTGNTCALLLVGVAHAFGTISHVKQGVRRMANRTLKELPQQMPGYVRSLLH